MNINVEETSSYERVLTIEVPPEKVTEGMENLYREISKTATHPGFRKGKVPRKLIEGRHAKSIREEAISTAVSAAAEEALIKQELNPLSEPVLGDVDFGDEGPLCFKLTIEVKPEVKLGEYKGITLERPKKEIGEEEVAKVLERLQLSHAKYSPVERPIENGDFIVFDFQAFEDGKPVDQGRGENFSLEVGSGQFGEDFEGQLIGVSKDEEKRIEVRYPDDYKAEELAGKEVHFEIKVKDVKSRELPELDDDFAKDLGEHETLDELKKHWKEKLAEDMEKRMENYLREQALAKIVESSDVDVPPRLRARVSASVFEEQVRNLAQYGTDRETITAQRDQIAEFAEKEAERQIQVSFVSDAIADAESLSISDEELDKSLEEMAKGSEGGGSDAPDIREYFKQPATRERYRDQLRAKKILDFIVEGAKIEEVEEAPADPEPQETEQDKEGDS